MKGIFKSGLAALLLCFAAGQALATTTLPPVKVHGRTIDAVTFECRSLACSDMLGNFGGVPASVLLPDFTSIGSEGQMMVSKQFVCDLLKYRKPENCSASSPPSVPGFDPNWRPNGCGAGPLSNFFLSQIVNGLYSDSFSGDLDAPYQLANGTNVSFRSACDAHDRCWGSGQNRGYCDVAFHNQLKAICSKLSGSDQYGCLGMAAGYFFVVSSDVAGRHYEDTQAELACAAWASDMKQNGCSS